MTFKAVEDILRCNPDFHHAPRYDGIIYRKDNGVEAFAKLVYITTHVLREVRYGVVLIQPLDANLGPRRQKDMDLGLYRVHAKRRDQCEVIAINSIVRGALIVKDIGCEFDDEYYVLDVIDCDMFQRMKTHFATRFPSLAKY